MRLVQGIASLGSLHKIVAYTRTGQLHVCDWQSSGTQGENARGKAWLGRVLDGAETLTNSSSLSVLWDGAADALTLPVRFLADKSDARPLPCEVIFFVAICQQPVLLFLPALDSNGQSHA